MSSELKKQIIEALKDQKNIFGDDLFDTEVLKRKTIVQKKNIEESITQELQEDLMINGEKENWQAAKNLEELNKQICECLNCPLGKNRTNFVFGSGNPNADVMVIGEGPGAEEDKQGLPFVGRAGKLLTDILKAINFEREEVYIANVVKCRPPANRTPLAPEMDECVPYLKKQIELIKPKLILLVGLTAAQGILKKKDSLTKMRGQVFEFENAKVMVTYHPAGVVKKSRLEKSNLGRCSTV